MKGWKKRSHANGNYQKKKVGIAVFLSDKIDFKTKTVTRDKGGHYIMIKTSTQQEVVMFVNIYTANKGASN